MFNKTKTISKITGIEIPIPLSDENFTKTIKKYSKYSQIFQKKDLATLEKYKEVFEVPTFVGIEVEVEGLSPKIPLPSFWNGKEDNSLRKGAEFYSAPLTPRQAFFATSFLYSTLGKLTNKKPSTLRHVRR